ncbi:MAG TPA: 2,4-dienoyl-CoA reductase, partial [Pseudomonas sp.]|nr:2,4-dienoyl-CoA reductase [Pseudomonas sp.]
DMVGIGTALAIEPDLPRQWRQARDCVPELPPITWKNKVFASLATMAVVKFQLHRLSKGQAPDPGVSPMRALVMQQIMAAFRVRKYRRWVGKRQAVVYGA